MSSQSGKTSHVHGIVVLGCFKEGPHGSPRRSPRISASASPGGLLETNTLYWVLQYLKTQEISWDLCVYKRHLIPKELLRPAGLGLRGSPSVPWGQDASIL